VRVGLISDTHGLLRPEALAALRGVDHIVHAGDAGAPEILERLARLAPLTAVRGNVDRGAWAERLPATAQVELGGSWFHVLHVLDDLDLDPRASGFAVVVYGHSHKPDCRRTDGVWFVNPGSAGPRRFRLPVTVALAEIEPAQVVISFVELPG
jgi:putative phosphoesterase